MAEIFERKNEAGNFGGFGTCAQSLFDIQRIFNTGPYWDYKIGLRHVFSWPKLGLEPKS